MRKGRQTRVFTSGDNVDVVGPNEHLLKISSLGRYAGQGGKDDVASDTDPDATPGPDQENVIEGLHCDPPIKRDVGNIAEIVD